MHDALSSSARVTLLRPRRLWRLRPRRPRTCRRRRCCGRPKLSWRRACRTSASRSSASVGVPERRPVRDGAPGERRASDLPRSGGARCGSSGCGTHRLVDGPPHDERAPCSRTGQSSASGGAVRVVRDSISQAAWIAASEAYVAIDQRSVFEHVPCRRCSSRTGRERRTVNTPCVSPRPSLTHAWC